MSMRLVWPSRPTFDSAVSEFDRLRSEMFRLLEGTGNEPALTTSAGVFPPLNVSQDDDNFYVRAEMPGVRSEDLTISAVRNRISITGRREIPRENERVSYHRKERAEGAFSRTLALPSEVNADAVEARYGDGILTLTLPKAEEAKPRQITVQS
ncbi:MAG: Hsp20/alpha crystallin family protein [Myxococcaceae bacterium]|nr:Hsp20/alpha crystallin family protein [Myxococcaceae bacterium]